jgi:hypothetical protein
MRRRTLYVFLIPKRLDDRRECLASCLDTQPGRFSAISLDAECLCDFFSLLFVSSAITQCGSSSTRKSPARARCAPIKTHVLFAFSLLLFPPVHTDDGFFCEVMAHNSLLLESLLFAVQNCIDARASKKSRPKRGTKREERINMFVT